MKLETGVDGVLDDLEVDRTDYVCSLFMAEIDAGEPHTCAAMSDGTARCWRRDIEGQPGDGTFTNSTSPVLVTSDTAP